jgi:hypothetical protein
MRSEDVRYKANLVETLGSVQNALMFMNLLNALKR